MIWHQCVTLTKKEEKNILCTINTMTLLPYLASLICLRSDKVEIQVKAS